MVNITLAAPRGSKQSFCNVTNQLGSKCSQETSCHLFFSNRNDANVCLTDDLTFTLETMFFASEVSALAS